MLPQFKHRPKMLLNILAIVCLLERVSSHGSMLDPPNRSSLWKFNPLAPINYNDNENFCGGFGIMWGVHNGKCGVCGDDYGDPVPRKNENTGLYGQGIIAAQYKSESVINITVLLTANHKGWFSYSLCDLKDPEKPETEDCFKDLLFEDNSKEAVIKSGIKEFHQRVRLPKDLKCARCVLRWTYKAGNSWGTCEDGSGSLGCGPQETFKNCADIAID